MGALLAISSLLLALSGAPEASPSPEPAYCPVHVAQVIAQPDGRSVIVGLATHDAPGVASGTVRLYSGDRAYDVSFEKAGIPKVFGELVTPATPLIVRFPAATPIDGALVTMLGDAPQAQPCPAADPWVGPLRDAEAGTPTHEIQARWRSLAKDATTVDAPAPVALPRAACATPFRRPRRISDPAPYPRGMGVRVAAFKGAIFVDVGTDGVASAATYIGDNDPAVETALRSHFDGSRWAPALARCEPVPMALTLVMGARATSTIFITGAGPNVIIPRGRR